MTTANQTPANQDVPEHIFEKIAAAQALADRAGTPGEAAAAAEAVQRLLFKYNLSAGAVNQRNSNAKKAKETQDATVGFEKNHFDVGSKTPWLTEWKKDLMYTVARNNFCRPMTQAGGGVIIIGQPHNVQVVLHMYEYLQKAIARLANEGWKAEVRYSAPYKPSSHERKWKPTFCEGAIVTINGRLAGLKTEMMGQLTGAENAIMVSQEDALNEAVYAMYPYLRPPSAEEKAKRQAEWEEYIKNNPPKPPKAGKQKKERVYVDRTDYSAYNAGRRAGETISLDKQVAK